MKIVALFLAVLLFPFELWAWESACRVYSDISLEPQVYASRSGPSCGEAPGPRTARNRWIGPDDEHRQLFLRAVERAGLPSSFLSTVDLRVFTDGRSVDSGGDEPIETVAPDRTWLNVRGMVTRSFSIPEFSQLPDFSYALWDWVNGHETCPLTADDVSAANCHSFTSHMGAVNSNHFLPQASFFYRYYHQLAATRATDCRTMGAALGPELARFREYVLECEAEALSLEAIAQHFLQDAWSGGHMWMRWGSPDLTDYPSFAGAPRRSTALFVAAVSGLIHGSRAVMQPHLEHPSG